MKFEHSALGILGVVVAALIGVTVMKPPQDGTALPESAGVSDMVTAAGPRMGIASEIAKGTDAVAGLDTAGAHSLWDTYRRMDYDFKAVLEKGAPVPRISLTSLPHDLDEINEVEKRKALFFKTVLPLILRVNEDILADRRRLWRVRYRLSLGKPIKAVDRLWLSVAADKYRVKPSNLQALMERMDIVPPSLALAQAAEESGWGTSRFVKEGNAIFGQWTFAVQDAMVPEERPEGKRHRIKVFENLIDSVRAYMHNLNTHRAYRELRKTRAALRRVGAPLDGLVLAAKLHRYSEKGWDYVMNLRSIILGNDLRELDDARLRDAQAPEEEPSV